MAEPVKKIADIRKERAVAFDAFKILADKELLTPEEATDYDAKKAVVVAFDDQLKRAQEASDLAAVEATPVVGQTRAEPAAATTTPARPENDPYLSEAAAVSRGLGTSKGLIVGGAMKMLARGAGLVSIARQEAIALYGENHPVTRALIVSTGSAGGFIVPPDYMAEIIELLRPKSMVRSANPRTIPMPRGTMTIPGQASPATAAYGSEVQKIAVSQQGLNQIVATYKKLTAMVPISNDMMRYADPAVDAFVRDDLVKVIALREDLAFLLGDGTQDTPRGFLSFALGWVQAGGGTVGSFSTTANSVLSVNGTDPANSTGGNFVTSNATYTLATVASEAGGAINRLDTANVPDSRRMWFWHPRTFNYLYNVQNALGLYPYRDELSRGTFLGYPFRKATTLAANYWDATGTNKDLSFIFLAEMDEAMIFDSMSLELAVSREGSYIDAAGSTISAFQNDQTLVRAIAEHDFQLRHDASVAVIQGVRWAPAIA